MVNMENVKKINNTRFNEEKTKELIEEMRSEGLIVGIEDLAGYLRTQGVIVNEHIGRKRNYVEVSPKLFGVDVTSKGDDVKELFKEHIKMGKMSFIPDSYEKLLVNLDSSVRMARRRLCIGYDGSFMPLEIFKQFSKDFEEKKKKYFEIRDDIVSRWDVLIPRFKSVLQNALEELNAIDRAAVLQNILGKLPSKEEYRNSFYMTLSVKAFPVTENLDMFEESIRYQIQDGLNEETVSTLYEILRNTLEDAFECVVKVLLSIQKNNDVSTRTWSSLQTAANRIGAKNIFNNNKINQIRLDIADLSGKKDDIQMLAEQAENILATIYGYANELSLDINLRNSPLSSEELMVIYSMLEN
ncbi:hypothetical protein NDS46_31165 (plasmid) [Paenibacillus thiaminolyticus]|uniref:hypothetical protein n=1 Tax=Paenibacillus thiaminolyticus TaxID=49283 RepID=UPI00232EB11A|nr:hypothetical protein [Paenibacillus thiaminolyticus]WCF11419.1 hypothetical protein NDS46_31165 [Paenibacillus thiaminolyticus]